MHAACTDAGRILTPVGTAAGIDAVLRPPGDAALEERIRVLRRRVYGPDARPEDVAALSASLAELPAPVVETPLSLPAEPGTGEKVPEATPDHGESSRQRFGVALRAVPPRLLAGGLGLAVLAAAVGAGIALLPQAAAPAAAAAAPRFKTALDVPADPSVLAHPAGTGDEQAALPGPELVGDSFRRLADYPAAGVTLWAARDRLGDTCLVAADTYFRTACADPATFAATGAALTWSAGPGYPASTTVAYTAVWRHGRLLAGPSS